MTSGKSREQLIPKLMRFLLSEPIGRLRLNIEKAASISEAQRQKSFSVLADKLMDKTARTQEEEVRTFSRD